jgi:DNA-binding transcriptional LysR family regulator
MMPLPRPAHAHGVARPLVAAGQRVALVPELGVIGPPADVALTPLLTRHRTRIAYRKGARHQPAASACIAAIRASARTLGLQEAEPPAS